jgi:hypothetical protein
VSQWPRHCPNWFEDLNYVPPGQGSANLHLASLTQI